MATKSNTRRPPQSNKLSEVPDKYQPGFLTRLDGRTEVAKLLRQNFAAIADDLGGEAELSRVKAALVERFVFLEATLNKIEAQMASDPDSSADVIGRWIQAVNSLTGLAKTLGIERVSGNQPWLHPSDSDDEEPGE